MDVLDKSTAVVLDAGLPRRVTRVGSGLRRSARYFGPVVVFALFIGFWVLSAEVLLPPHKRFLLPAPTRVVTTVFTDWKTMKPILSALWLSTQVAFTGFMISIVLGMVIGIIMSRAAWIEWALWPYAVALQCIPILALTPLIGGLIGFSFNARVVVTVMISLFPIMSNTLFGILSVDPSLHDLLTIRGATRRQSLFKIQLPAALPSIFAGVRISAGLAVIGAVVGDTFFRQGEPGIGALIDVFRLRLQGEQMMASIILAAALGIAVFVLVGYLSRRAVGQWHEDTRRP